MFGFLELPVWGYIVVTLVFTHITIAAVTIYLHRCQAHRALDLHPVVSHFFRFWLWLTTGMTTKEWVAVHRKHHAFVETEQDPHSPQVYGINKVMWEGAELYRESARDEETLKRYGHGTPDDWMERNVYSRFSNRGYVLMLFINVALFGVVGLTIWAVQMMWIPVFAAGIINGVGHWAGYRKYQTPDTSRNIVPWGIVIGGEELHNNHHAFASSARFSMRWWEFDIGWLYIRLMSALGLARVKKIAPRPIIDPAKRTPDLDTVSAVISNRFHVMSQYARTVLGSVYSEEIKRLDSDKRGVLRRARTLLSSDETMLSSEARARLDTALKQSEALRTAMRDRQRLQAIWQERSASQEGLLQSLQQWCREAEASGIRALQDFARTLPRYSTQAA